MSKHLSLAARIIVAILGIAFIVWQVDWTDHVKLPQGTVLPDGQTLQAPATFKVISGIYNSDDPQSILVLLIKHDPSNPLTMQISSGQISVEGSTLSFVPGMLKMLKAADIPLVALGLLLVGLILPVLVVRWWMLMRCRSIQVPLFRAFRLTMVGLFFNFCLPGTTGGDVVKAYYAAKGSNRRAEAVMTVIVDRIAGLLGLVILAGVVGLFMFDDPVAHQITINIWLGAAVFALAAVVYFSRRLRRNLGIDWLLQKMPMQHVLSKIDEAATAYRGHKPQVLLAIALSLIVHLFIATATATAGYALGMDKPLGLLLTVVPVLFLAAAIPISPQGIGVMELLAIALIVDPPLATTNQIVGMLLLIRIYQIVYGLLGSIFLFKGDIHLHPQDPQPQAKTQDQIQPYATPLTDA